MIKTRMKTPPTQSQINLADRLRRLRLNLGLSLQEVANKIGISKVTLLRYETLDITNIPSNNIEKLADVYKTTPSYIMGWDEQEAEFTVTAPLLDHIIYEPIDTIENMEWLEINETCDYCFRAEGDSMSGIGIYDGDLILIDKTNHLENGEIGVIRVDETVTLKKFYHYPEKDLIVLRPANLSYEDQACEGEQLKNVQIIGRIKFLIRNYKKQENSPQKKISKNIRTTKSTPQNLGSFEKIFYGYEFLNYIPSF